jgi:hypothetical protein
VVKTCTNPWKTRTHIAPNAQVFVLIQITTNTNWSGSEHIELGSLEMTACIFIHHDPSRANNRTTYPSLVNLVPTSLQESFDLMVRLQHDLMLR